jgi:DNA repair protein RadC
MQEHVSIADMPVDERPREPMMRGGAVALSDAELVALLIEPGRHPSGDPSPSPQDLAFTRRLVESGQVLGVEVLDHVIVAASGYVSLKQRNLM